jgi:hypothetical protein
MLLLLGCEMAALAALDNLVALDDLAVSADLVTLAKY